MKNSIALIFIFSVLVSSCSIWEYGKAVGEEARVRSSLCKKAMFKTAFTGYILEKNYCNECRDKKSNPHTYSVKIKLINDTLHPWTFSPCYCSNQENFSILNTCVSKDFFNSINVNDTITKNTNDSTIAFKGKTLIWFVKNGF